MGCLPSRTQEHLVCFSYNRSRVGRREAQLCFLSLSVKRRDNMVSHGCNCCFFLEFLNYWSSCKIPPLEVYVADVSWQPEMVLWDIRWQWSPPLGEQ